MFKIGQRFEAIEEKIEYEVLAVQENRVQIRRITKTQPDRPGIHLLNGIAWVQRKNLEQCVKKILN